MQITDEPTFCSEPDKECGCNPGDQIYAGGCLDENDGSLKENCDPGNLIAWEEYFWLQVLTDLSGSGECPSQAVEPEPPGTGNYEYGCFCRSGFDVQMPDDSQGTFDVEVNVASIYTN